MSLYDIHSCSPALNWALSNDNFMSTRMLFMRFSFLPSVIIHSHIYDKVFRCLISNNYKYYKWYCFELYSLSSTPKKERTVETRIKRVQMESWRAIYFSARKNLSRHVLFSCHLELRRESNLPDFIPVRHLIFTRYNISDIYSSCRRK